jgi:diacylglycerol kinase (ATP)
VRIVILANPAAGSADALADADVCGVLRDAGHDVQLQRVTRPSYLQRAAARAVRAGAEVVVAAGGDGTLNAVLNGVAQVRGGLTRVTLGLLPLGTGNDFARTLGVPIALEDAVACLAAGRTRRLDAARLDDRLFINASGGGFTAATSAHVSSRLKAWVGRAAYLVGGAQALVEHRPVLTEVTLDRERLLLPLHLFAVCNGRTLGGGHTLAPRAEPDDGWLDVCLVHGTSTMDLVALLPKLSSGGHVHEGHVRYARARRVTMRFARVTPVNTDGEALHAARCLYDVLPGVVSFIC